MLTFKKASGLSQFDDYYALKSDQDSINWSGFENAPDYSRLREHYEKLVSSDKLVLFFSAGDKVVGYSQISFDGNTAEVDGYSVLSAYCGHGFGSRILATTIDYLRDNVEGVDEIVAWVSEKNAPSLKCFAKNSFAVVGGQCRHRELKALRRTDRFILLKRPISLNSND